MKFQDLIKNEKTEEELKNDPIYHKSNAFIQSLRLEDETVKNHELNQEVD